jgi:hypothetical protein
MPKLVKILWLCFALLAADTIISIILATGYGVIQRAGGSYHSIRSAPEAALFLGIMRLIFFFVVTVIGFYLLNMLMEWKNRPLQVAVLNAGIYVFLSLVYGLIIVPDTSEWLTNGIFYIITISAFLSPFILYRIGHFRKIMNDL